MNTQVSKTGEGGKKKLKNKKIFLSQGYILPYF